MTVAEKTLAGGARSMGRTGLTISRLGYGGMELAGPPLARDLGDGGAVRFINRVIDSGINYIDTSIDYGLSERLIGEVMRRRRSEVVLASKCGCQVGEIGPGHGEKHTFSYENVMAGIEQSLRRLQTDHLDVVQVHGRPSRKEVEEGGTVEAMLKAKEQGKVRHLGISTRLPTLAEFIDADYFSVVQVPYSALQRNNEDAIAALRRAGKAVVCRGVTGRGSPGKDWATRPIGTEEGEARAVWERARLDELLDGMSRIEFMIRYVLSNDNVDTAIVATTSEAHLAANIEHAGKGPLPSGILDEARRRLAMAGSAPGQGKYRGGGPTPVL
jgi:aryl-alcohol dehydrogenase-like predicted oxidoreductase